MGRSVVKQIQLLPKKSKPIFITENLDLSFRRLGRATDLNGNHLNTPRLKRILFLWKGSIVTLGSVDVNMGGFTKPICFINVVRSASFWIHITSFAFEGIWSSRLKTFSSQHCINFFR